MGEFTQESQIDYLIHSIQQRMIPTSEPGGFYKGKCSGHINLLKIHFQYTNIFKLPSRAMIRTWVGYLSIGIESIKIQKNSRTIIET